LATFFLATFFRRTTFFLPAFFFAFFFITIAIYPPLLGSTTGPQASAWAPFSTS
jgi:hypothetical protein